MTAGEIPLQVMDLDCSAETERISHWLTAEVGQVLRRRGVVVGLSGGVDSSVCVALAARALGLGATLTTWHLVLESEFKAVLGIPRSVHTFAVIPVGWPRGRFGPVARHAPADVLHRDGW